MIALGALAAAPASASYGARQIPVGIYNVNDAQGRPTKTEAAEARMYAIRFVLDTTTTLHRFFSGFNLEGVYSNDKNALAPEPIRTKCTNKQVKGDPDGAGPEDCGAGDSRYESTPSPLPTGWTVGKGRIGYAHGTGGTIRASLVPVKADGTPDMANVIAKDTFNPVARYEKLISEYGIPGKSGMLYAEFGGKIIHADTPYAVVYQNVDEKPRMNYVSYNSPVTNASVAGPNGQNTLDPNATGAVLGLDPREAVAWSTDGGETWGWGHAVGGSTSTGAEPHEWPDYVGAGDDDVKMPWYAWTTTEGAAATRYSNQPYSGEGGAGNYRLVVNDVPRAVTLTEAGGYAPIGSSVGVVIVKNLRTGQDGITASLGTGLQAGALDEGVELAVGDDYEITHSGAVAMATGDGFQEVLKIVKDSQPYTTEKCAPDEVPTCVESEYQYADRAELFATPFPFFPAPKPPIPVWTQKLGSSGTGSGQFDQPYGVAVDDQGNLWVADDVNRRVQKLSAETGEFLLMVGKEVNKTKVEEGGASEAEENLCTAESEDECGPGTGSEVPGIAVGPEGDVWAVESTASHIAHYNTDGEYLGQVGTPGKGEGQINSPRGLAFDEEGNLLVADQGNHRIVKLSPEGKFLDEFGAKGEGDGQFKSPSGVTVDPKGNVWVADTLNDRVQKFDSSGKFLAKYGSAGSGNGKFQSPFAIGANPNGTIWVSDSSNHRIQALNGQGEYLIKFGKSGSGNGELSQPKGLAFDAEGDVWVADRNNDRVQEWELIYPGTPKVTTEGASAVESNSAHLYGKVNPQGTATYHFEYDTTPYKAGEGPHGTSVPVPAQSIGPADQDISVSYDLKGLQPLTTYHFRLVAESEAGNVVFGEDKSFKTP